MAGASAAIVAGLAGLLAAGTLAAADAASADAAATNAPTVLTAGEDWVPVRAELDIEPGSALDFSGLGFTDAPAGKHGRVIARPDGRFAFADSPTEPRRFYGVNLCFGAQYLAPAEADRLVERLARLGYNALRVHHYERDLTQAQTNTTTLNPRKLDQLDYLLAACIRRGIYLTTDLFVSRSVPYREVGIDRDGHIPMDTFKILVPVHEGAFNNWRKFARAFLCHENPYTHRRYAAEPALAWLALINEGNFGNFFREIQGIPEWKQAWNRWLATQYPNRAALLQAWGDALNAGENPATGDVALPEKLQADGPRCRDCVRFLADTERDMVRRMKTVLREELGCQALVSNASSWTRFTTDQAARTVYDYVDDHFYVDHPQFLETPWRLPSRCPNTSPLREGAPGGRGLVFTRLFDKPFTVTEYNYSGPGRFRGVGGLLTGALGALQDWGGVWRFAYAHSREAVVSPSRLGYFDVASDPLSQAAERAALCLFLRGDLQTASHSVALVMTAADLAQPTGRIPTLAPKWHWLAWVTRLGTQVLSAPSTATPHLAVLPLGWQTPASAYPAGQALALAPYALEDEPFWRELQRRGLSPPGDPTDPSQRSYRSETGELTIDGPHDRLVVDTPRTAGGYAPAGQTIEAAHAGVRLAIEGADATVWVSALDANPIRRSRRLLLSHLTDVQNTGIRYAEPARRTLLDWGSLPHLARAGKAVVSLRLESPGAYHVWALSLGGKRLAEAPVQVEGDTLRFTAEVAAAPAAGARLLYEVVRP